MFKMCVNDESLHPDFKNCTCSKLFFNGHRLLKNLQSCFYIRVHYCCCGWMTEFLNKSIDPFLLYISQQAYQSKSYKLPSFALV